MKKLLLTLGSVAAVAAPITATISCSSDPKADSGDHKKTKILTKDLVPTSLAGYKIPASYTAIGEDAFKGKTLPDGFTLPSSITAIGKNAFAFTTLPDGFTIPSSVTSVGDSAFAGAFLPGNFAIPTSVKTIGAFAFATPQFKDSSMYWVDKDGKKIVDQDKPIVGDYIDGPKILTQNMVDAYLKTHNNDLTGFKFPNTLTTIGDAAFSGATLPSGFTIPSSVTTIADNAFQGATLLDGFKLPDKVTTIGDFAFEDTTLPSSFTIPSSVTTIGLGAFSGATLPNGFTLEHTKVIDIRINTFLNVALPSNFKLPNTATTIGDHAFEGATIPLSFKLPHIQLLAMEPLEALPSPAGFTIPYLSVIEDDLFKDAILPIGMFWLDKDGKKLANQQNPPFSALSFTGCYVGKP